MDEDICRWILEFLLRNSMKDCLFKRLLAALPVSNTDPRLKKTVLLRSIETEISDAAVTETILELLETIEDLDESEGVTVMESMKAAYCAVAVECTVKYLVGSVDRNVKYFEAVKRIWRGRVMEILREGKSGLVSRELKGWRKEVETAIWDVNVAKKLTYLNTRNNALRLVRDYLGEAWAILGPSFVELSAMMVDKGTETENGMRSDRSGDKECREGVEKMTRVGEDAGGSCGRNFAEFERLGGEEPFREDGRKGIGSPNIIRDLCVNDGFKELSIVQVNNGKVREVATETADRTEVQGSVKNRMTDKVSEGRVLDDVSPSLGADKPAAKDEENLKICVLPRRKFLASHRRVRGGAKISNPEDLESETLSGRNGCLLTPEVNRVQEALKASSLDLQAVVEDPLPDALRVSEAVISNLVEKNKSHEQSSESQKDVDAINRAANKGVKPLRSWNISHEQSSENQKDADAANPATDRGVEPLRSWNISHEQSSENRKDADAANPATDKGDEPLHSGNHAIENSRGGHQKIVLQPSLMERNGTARTYEWNDSIDDSPERTGNHTSRLHLPSPKRKAVSPLKKYEETKFARRRKSRRWSLLEEDTLRNAVQKFGKGNWKLILNSHRDVFEERTEVDLKDKWRNMTRY